MKILVEGVTLEGMIQMEPPACPRRCNNNCSNNCMVDCDLKLPCPFD